MRFFIRIVKTTSVVGMDYEGYGVGLANKYWMQFLQRSTI